MFVVLSQVWDKENILSLHEESNLRPSDSDALLLNHKDSLVSEVYFKVNTTFVLYTARMSNVDSVTFVNRMKKKVIFFFPTLVTRCKTSLSVSLPSSKLTIFLIL